MIIYNVLQIFHRCSFKLLEGAALQLFMLGLLDAEGLRSATQGCLEEFGDIDVGEFASTEVKLSWKAQPLS